MSRPARRNETISLSDTWASFSWAEPTQAVIRSPEYPYSLEKPGHAASIAVIVENGKGDIDLQNGSGASPLHCAALNGQANAAQKLLELGVV